VSTNTRRNLAIGVTLGVACTAYWLLLPWVPERAARAASIVIIAAGFWATEALPLFATAFVEGLLIGTYERG
jgi:hypothetical protein